MRFPFQIVLFEICENSIFLQISRTLRSIIFISIYQFRRISISVHLSNVYIFKRAHVDPSPSIVPKCRKISSERRCLTNVHSWPPMLTHDCGSCVKERAVSVSLHARKLVARSEKGEGGGAYMEGGVGIGGL